jgi:hypothetical protein
MELLKSVTGKIIAGAVALAVVAGGISWWQMDPDARSQLMGGAGRVFAWLGTILLLPWATFFGTTWVARRQSNAAGAVLVLGYTVVGFAVLLWLFDFTISGAMAWTFVAAATLLAAVYNLLTCDWIAERLGGS